MSIEQYIKIFDPENPENVYVIPVNADYIGIGDWDSDGNDELFVINGDNFEKVKYHASLSRNNEDLIQYEDILISVSSPNLVNAANMFSLNLDEYSSYKGYSTSDNFKISLKKSDKVNRVELYLSAHISIAIKFYYENSQSITVAVQPESGTDFGYYYIIKNPYPDSLVTSIELDFGNVTTTINGLYIVRQSEKIVGTTQNTVTSEEIESITVLGNTSVDNIWYMFDGDIATASNWNPTGGGV